MDLLLQALHTPRCPSLNISAVPSTILSPTSSASRPRHLHTLSSLYPPQRRIRHTKPHHTHNPPERCLLIHTLPQRSSPWGLHQCTISNGRYQLPFPLPAYPFPSLQQCRIHMKYHRSTRATPGNTITTSHPPHLQRLPANLRIDTSARPVTKLFRGLRAYEFTAILTREKSLSNALTLDVKRPLAFEAT